MNVESKFIKILDMVSPNKVDWSDNSLYDAPLTGEKLQFAAEDLVYLVLELKDCFNIEFDSSDFENYRFNSYKSILNIVKSKLEEKHEY